MFKVGDKVTRIGKNDGHIGIICDIITNTEWPHETGITLIVPRVYFIQFCCSNHKVGMIDGQFSLDTNPQIGDTTCKFKIGDNVTVQTIGNSPKDGYITKLWAGSSEEKTSGRYGLDKYHVQFYDGNNGWFYGCDISKK